MSLKSMALAEKFGIVTAAQKRLRIRFGITAAVYLLCDPVLRSFYISLPQAVWIQPALPALFSIAIIVNLAVYLKEETDEFQSMLTQRSLLWSIGITLIAATIWNFLETVRPGWHHLLSHPAGFLFFVFILFFAIARNILRFRHRSNNE